MSDYLPGSFFVVDVAGPGGFWIGVAQALVNDASRYKHCGLILHADGTILEAEPGGARLANIAEYAGDGLIVCDGPVQQWLAANVLPGDPKGRAAVETTLRRDLVTQAHNYVGIGYSWLDYAAIAALHLQLPSKALRRYVASSGHVQCAQLVDAVYAAESVHLFADGRQPGEVCPADLAAWAEDWAARR